MGSNFGVIWLEMIFTVAEGLTDWDIDFKLWGGFNKLVNYFEY